MAKNMPFYNVLMACGALWRFNGSLFFWQPNVYECMFGDAVITSWCAQSKQAIVFICRALRVHHGSRSRGKWGSTMALAPGHMRVHHGSRPRGSTKALNLVLLPTDLQNRTIANFFWLVFLARYGLWQKWLGEFAQITHYCVVIVLQELPMAARINVIRYGLLGSRNPVLSGCLQLNALFHIKLSFQGCRSESFILNSFKANWKLSVEDGGSESFIIIVNVLRIFESWGYKECLQQIPHVWLFQGYLEVECFRASHSQSFIYICFKAI